MADNNKVLTVTDQNFHDEIEGADGVAMVDFWAEWCGPCRIIAPTVAALADDYASKGLKVGKLDVDANPQTAARYQVRSIPTVLFFKNGEMVDRLVGAMPRPHFEAKVQSLL